MLHFVPRFTLLFLTIGISLFAVDFSSLTPKDHPRLLFTEPMIEQAKLYNNTDNFYKELTSELEHTASFMMNEPPVPFSLDKEGLLLERGRIALSRILACGILYKLKNEKQYKQRLIQELTALCEFPNWKPDHFLDTAEIGTAVAIGYDWLYDELTEAQRQMCETALAEKLLKAAEATYSTPKGWHTKNNNWNFVCNSGVIIGAIAVWEKYPKLAESSIKQALKSIPTALETYLPDGVWFEGPAYWHYGTTYLTMGLSAIETSFGTDFGLFDHPGIERSAYCRSYMIGPSGLYFNYSDCSKNVKPSPAVFRLAERYRRDDFIPTHIKALKHDIIDVKEEFNGQYVLDDSRRFFPLEFVWYKPEPAFPPESMPTARLFKGKMDLAVFDFRKGENHIYAGFKGGSNSLRKAHLDAGNFVLDAAGERWVWDLGKESYRVEGYFDRSPNGKRWKCYRASTRSHNTLMINGKNQSVLSECPITLFHNCPDCAHATVDLTPAYREQAVSVVRGMRVNSDETVLIQDEISGLKESGTVRWAITTRAKLALNGPVASMSRGGKKAIASKFFFIRPVL